MTERKEPWDRKLQVVALTERPHDSYINLDLPTYISMAFELADRVENLAMPFPNKLFFLPGSTHLASVVSEKVGIYSCTKINIAESPECIVLDPQDSVIIAANQNLDHLMVFANSLKAMYNPQSLLVAVLFEKEGKEDKADIAIYQTKFRVKFPSLPEINLLP